MTLERLISALLATSIAAWLLGLVKSRERGSYVHSAIWVALSIVFAIVLRSASPFVLGM